MENFKFRGELDFTETVTYSGSGYINTASGPYSTAIGSQHIADGGYSTAIGIDTRAYRPNTITVDEALMRDGITICVTDKEFNLTINDDGDLDVLRIR